MFAIFKIFKCATFSATRGYRLIEDMFGIANPKIASWQTWKKPAVDKHNGMAVFEVSQIRLCRTPGLPKRILHLISQISFTFPACLVPRNVFRLTLQHLRGWPNRGVPLVNHFYVFCVFYWGGSGIDNWT